ncbi:MAG TPA: hypothetical protein PKY50_19105 [Candidatus Competibacter sp.]|nr:hypothetical protein [Candidatus Competibacter sp.]
MKKQKFQKLSIEIFRLREVSSLMNRGFFAGMAYTFQIGFRFLAEEIGISEDSKLAF